MTQTYDRQAAFYANADYTYDRRYSVSATFRYDGNNGLGSSSLGLLVAYVEPGSPLEHR